MYAFLDLYASLSSSWVDLFKRSWPQTQAAPLIRVTRESQQLLERRGERARHVLRSLAALSDHLRETAFIPGGLVGPAASTAWLDWSHSVADAAFEDFGDQVTWTGKVGQEVLAATTNVSATPSAALATTGRDLVPTPTQRDANGNTSRREQDLRGELPASAA